VQVGLPVFAVHGEGVVATQATSNADGERISETGFVDDFSGDRLGAVDRLGGFTEQAAVSRDMVALVYPGKNADLRSWSELSEPLVLRSATDANRWVWCSSYDGKALANHDGGLSAATTCRNSAGSKSRSSASLALLTSSTISERRPRLN
jgi:hypothetical protein